MTPRRTRTALLAATLSLGVGAAAGVPLVPPAIAADAAASALVAGVDFTVANPNPAKVAVYGTVQAPVVTAPVGATVSLEWFRQATYPANQMLVAITGAPTSGPYTTVFSDFDTDLWVKVTVTSGDRTGSTTTKLTNVSFASFAPFAVRATRIPSYPGAGAQPVVAGSVTVGQQLAADIDRPDRASNVDLAWVVNGVVRSTDTFFTPTLADHGKQLELVATARGQVFQPREESVALGLVNAAQAVALARIDTVDLRVGQATTADVQVQLPPVQGLGTPTRTFRWIDATTSEVLAETLAWTPTAADVGRVVRFEGRFIFSDAGPGMAPVVARLDVGTVLAAREETPVAPNQPGHPNQPGTPTTPNQPGSGNGAGTLLPTPPRAPAPKKLAVSATKTVKAGKRITITVANAVKGQKVTVKASHLARPVTAKVNAKGRAVVKVKAPKLSRKTSRKVVTLTVKVGAKTNRVKVTVKR